MNSQIYNATMRRFGAPETVIRQYQYWSVLLRPAQVTLGALVLIAHEPALTFSSLSSASFSELKIATGQIEFGLKKAFQYNKLNYLMLMMTDPDVHFHVIPRYAGKKEFSGMTFLDAGWPGVPDFSKINQTDSALNHQVIDHLLSCWESH